MRWAYDENVWQWLWQEQHTDTAHHCFNNISIDHQNTIKSWFHSREEKWTAYRFFYFRVLICVFVCIILFVYMCVYVCVHTNKHVCLPVSICALYVCVCVQKVSRFHGVGSTTHRLEGGLSKRAWLCSPAPLHWGWTTWPGSATCAQKRRRVLVWLSLITAHELENAAHRVTAGVPSQGGCRCMSWRWCRISMCGGRNSLTEMTEATHTCMWAYLQMKVESCKSYTERAVALRCF